ncbi:MAG: GAF domain-containing protein, partial [Chloroflexota bacterium]
FNVDQSTITLVSEDFKHLAVAALAGTETGYPLGAAIPLENTPNEVVIRENRVYIPSDSMGLEIGEMKSILSGPIAIGNNVLGTLNLASTMVNAFNDRDANFLNQLLSLMNASVENRRLFEQIESALLTTEEQARSLAELNRLSEQFSSATSVDEVIALILENLNKIINADEWAFTTIDEKDGTYEIVMSPEQVERLSSDSEQPITTTQPLANTIVSRAAKERRTIIEFSCKDSAYTDVRFWAEQRGIQTVMSAPLFAGSTLLGVLNTGSKDLSAYTVQDENIIQSIASLAGSTIDNRRLFTQIQKRSQQLETSAEVSRVASTILDPTELLPRVIELIKEGFDLYYAGIFLIDETGEITGEPNKWAVLRAGSGDAGDQMVAAGHKLEVGSESMIGTAISNAQARIALNVGDEASFFANPYLPNTRSEMALPLTSRGAVVGALSIQSEIADAFSPEDITALQTMADQLANAIENARLFEQTEIRAEELTVLNEMARGFTQSMDVDELVKNTFEFTGRMMDAANFYMVLYSAEDDILENKLFVQAGQIITPPQSRVKLGPGLTEWIIQNKLPVLMPTDAESHIEALGVEITGEVPKSWLGVPMLLGNEVTGVIAVQNFQNENVYNNHSLDLLIAVSSQAAVAIDNAQRFGETQTRARHEEILRRVTTQVHATTDPDAILRTAVREVSDALGKPAFVKLSSADQAVGSGFETSPPPAPDFEPPSQQPAAGPIEPSGDSEER